MVANDMIAVTLGMLAPHSDHILVFKCHPFLCILKFFLMNSTAFGREGIFSATSTSSNKSTPTMQVQR